MTHKPIADLSESEAAQRREYNRIAKARSRAGKPPEKDARGYRDRAEYMREYRKINQIKVDWVTN